MAQAPPQKTELIITKDGSHTLYSNQFDQQYHNINGAVVENRHTFFEQNGLLKAMRKKDRINILEIGFGTGLNLLLLMDACLSAESTAKISYHGIEAYPISVETARSLNYGHHLNHPACVDKLPVIFEQLKPGFNTFSITPHINLSLFYGLFTDYKPVDPPFDFIFHDAFSPDSNPALWTGNVFKNMLTWCRHDAILSTYCAASKARGAMAWAGWKVARAEGAPGKREMTVASPSANPLSHLKRVNEERLARRYEEGDF